MFWIVAALADTTRYDLKTAFEMAQGASVSIQKAETEVEEAQAEASVLTSGLLPKANLVAKPSTQKDNVYLVQALFNGQPYNFYTFDLQARQNLAFWGEDWKKREAASHRVSVTEFDLEVARRDVVAKTLTLYAKIQRLDREKQILIKHRGVLSDLETLATHKRSVGRFSTLDLMEIQSERALLEPNLTDVERDLSGALVEFKTVVGGSTSFDLATSLEAMTDRARKAPEPTFVDHADLRRASLDQEQSEIERAITFARHLPTVSLFANYGRQVFTLPDLVNPYGTAWSFGIEINIPIFSGLSSLGESRASAAKSKILELHKREVRETLSEQQVRTREAFGSALRGLESRSRAFELADKAQKEGARGYRDGRYDFLRYFKLEESRLRAETELAKAHESLVKAFLDRALAYGAGLREISWLGEGA